MADPHRPLYLDDPEPYGNAWAYFLARSGYNITETKLGCHARRRNNLILPEAVANRVRWSLGRAQGWRCAYCAEPIALKHRRGDHPRALELSLDHRVPLSGGGTWKRSNLLAACEPCNTTKADLSEAEYRGLLAQFPPEPSGRWRVPVRREAKRLIGARDRARRLTASGAVPGAAFDKAHAYTEAPAAADDGVAVHRGSERGLDLISRSAVSGQAAHEGDLIGRPVRA